MSAIRAVRSLPLNVLPLLAATAIAALPFQARADFYSLAPGEVPFSLEELETLTDGNTLIYQDKSRATFSSDGSFSYLPFDQDSIEFGMFELHSDGRMCVELPGAFNRCDLYVKGRKANLIVTEGGERMRFRIMLSLE